MTTELIKQEMTELTEFLEYHAHKYYVEDSPETSDATYDSKMRRLAELEEQHPELKQENSPTERVGGVALSSLQPAVLDTPMLSLDNAMNAEETVTTFERIHNNASVPFVDGKLDVVAEPKLDGLALELTYEYGKLVVAKTRGDGTVGENVTHTAKTVNSIPLKLKGGESIPLIQIRGEVFMPMSSFNRCNERAVQKGTKPFANPRNAAAGSLRQLNPKVTAERGLDFIPYSLAMFDGDESLIPDSHFELLQFFGKLGFKVNPLTKKISSLEEAEAYHDHLVEIRAEIPYEIDGIVFKLDSRTLQEEAGYTSSVARFAIARKFPAQEVDTVINDIVLEVGRTGMIAPTAKVDTVYVGGVNVSSATLHNFDIIKSKGLAIGDRVIVYRAGDVVPSIRAKLKDGENRVVVDEPTSCPRCGSATMREESDKGEGARLYCTGGVQCESQALEALKHFASRSCMNMDGVGEKLVESLFESKSLRTFSDFFRLTEEDVLRIPRQGQKSSGKAIASIRKVMKVDLGAFISSLTIRGIGGEKAKMIAKEMRTIEAVMDATAQQLESIQGIGETNAASVRLWMDNEDNRKQILDMIELGLEFEEIQESSQELAGQTWVLTGTLSKMTRNEAKAILEGMGAKVSGSVSKNTHGIAYGENAGSKLAKANELIAGGANIRLLDEDQFIAEFVN